MGKFNLFFWLNIVTIDIDIVELKINEPNKLPLVMKIPSEIELVESAIIKSGQPFTKGINVSDVINIDI